jgi:nicotinamidase-related amidase
MKNKPDPSRREFLKRNSMAGIATVMTKGISSSILGSGSGGEVKSVLSITPRYHRWYVDPGVEWIETNTGYATLDWKIPVEQTALVLVDVWQRHYLKDTEARSEVIITNKLVPLMNACRKAGLTVIHAPSPVVAKKLTNWVKLAGGETQGRSDWPPSEFLNLRGQFESFRRPVEPREAELQKIAQHQIHSKALPLENEPVVATGEELHLYCKQKGILFLLFAGFNTNACILSRDYGTMQMKSRGYQTILVRDCTTGMENKETQPTLAQTNGTILMLEMFGHYSVESGEIIAGLG